MRPILFLFCLLGMLSTQAQQIEEIPARSSSYFGLSGSIMYQGLIPSTTYTNSSFNFVADLPDIDFEQINSYESSWNSGIKIELAPSYKQFRLLLSYQRNKMEMNATTPSAIASFPIALGFLSGSLNSELTTTSQRNSWIGIGFGYAIDVATVGQEMLRVVPKVQWISGENTANTYALDGSLNLIIVNEDLPRFLVSEEVSSDFTGFQAGFGVEIPLSKSFFGVFEATYSQFDVSYSQVDIQLNSAALEDLPIAIPEGLIDGLVGSSSYSYDATHQWVSFSIGLGYRLK